MGRVTGFLPSCALSVLVLVLVLGGCAEDGPFDADSTSTDSAVNPPATVREGSAEAPSASIPDSGNPAADDYRIGDSFAVRVPEELTPYELGDRLQIGYQAVDWTANLGADPYNPAALEDSGLGGWTLGEAISTGEAVPFTVGAASGYRYDAVSASGDCGTVIIIFPSLGPAGSPPGRITITADEDTFDARQVFDDPLFIGVLDSVKAPQD